MHLTKEACVSCPVSGQVGHIHTLKRELFSRRKAIRD